MESLSWNFEERESQYNRIQEKTIEKIKAIKYKRIQEHRIQEDKIELL